MNQTDLKMKPLFLNILPSIHDLVNKQKATSNKNELKQLSGDDNGNNTNNKNFPNQNKY